MFLSDGHLSGKEFLTALKGAYLNFPFISAFTSLLIT